MADSAETNMGLHEHDKQSQLLQKLQLMQAKFINGLDDRLDQIADAWVTLLEDRKNVAALERLHRDLHSLCGTSGTYALTELSQKSRELEVFFKGLTQMANFELNHEIEVQASSMLQDLIEIAQNQQPVQMLSPSPQTVSVLSDKSMRVLILEDDESVSELLSQQFDNFGFEVACVNELAILEPTFDQFRPSIIISEISFPIGNLAGVRALEEIKTKHKLTVPIIFVSGRQDIDARLAAIRVGGAAYLSKPINLSNLMDKVSELSQSKTIHPPKVMIVDDDIGLTQFMTVVLEKSGMRVEVVNDPLKSLEVLSEFMPDLILMDYHMPGCNGIELAQIIRQDSKYMRLPILFLSGEMDESLKFSAMIEGGDDLISKPIKADVLTTVVAAKARRARQLSDQIITDGLTGLFNHSHIEYLLEQEASRSLRDKNNFALVILDIDHFKKVNDTYGHTSGDSVLRSLSYMLKNRLRQTDLVGRFGGEEFVIIMPGTSTKQAQATMNVLLNIFSQIKHQPHSLEAPFYVTFSAGIADFVSANNSKEKLFEYADKALYQAKEGGRNRIEVF